jgi:hypothetical protein
MIRSQRRMGNDSWHHVNNSCSCNCYRLVWNVASYWLVLFQHPANGSHILKRTLGGWHPLSRKSNQLHCFASAWCHSKPWDSLTDHRFGCRFEKMLKACSTMHCRKSEGLLHGLVVGKYASLSCVGHFSYGLIHSNNMSSALLIAGKPIWLPTQQKEPLLGKASMFNLAYRHEF